MTLSKMNRKDVSKFVESTGIYVLPVGSTEQHGYHLPYSTDTLLAKFIAERISESLKAFCMPEIHYGYSWVWRDIPGSITISQKTFQNVIEDIAFSLDHLNAEKLIIINGHDANNASLKYATREISDRIRTEVYYIFYPDFKEAYAKYCETNTWNGIFHADELETSLMLYAYPELVDMENAVAEYPDKPKEYGYSATSLGKISNSGTYGNPTNASREKGKKLFQFFIKRVLEIVQ